LQPAKMNFAGLKARWWRCMSTSKSTRELRFHLVRLGGIRTTRL